MTDENILRALAYVGIDARILASGLVDLGCTPCDGEYTVRARVSVDGSAELHVLTNGRASLTEATEYGTYECARSLALAASNVLHD
jgi:hypothetical protein